MICADRTEARIVRGLCDAGADFLICPSGVMFGPKSNDPIVQKLRCARPGDTSCLCIRRSSW